MIFSTLFSTFLRRPIVWLWGLGQVCCQIYKERPSNNQIVSHHHLAELIIARNLMSSVSRVLKKRRQGTAAATNPQPTDNSTNNSSFSTPNSNAQGPQKPQYDAEREKQFEEYADWSQSNPTGFEFSNSFIPASLSLFNRYRPPMSCFINPINEDLEYVEQSGGSIPRCGSCRAYINYYTQMTRKGFKCFLCGRDNSFDCEYDIEADRAELKQVSYLVDGPSGVYMGAPPEHSFVFLIDVSKDAWQCKMLAYLVNVMREVLSREDLDDTQIHVYTYDETIHEYDFSGDEVERTILDPSIRTPTPKNSDSPLSLIRNKLLAFLDSLEEMAERNTKTGSNFFSILEYVYENVKHTGSKLLIFQASEAIAGQNFVNENFKWNTNQQQAQKPKSFLESKNKMFFNRFVQPMLNDNISMGLFVFAKGYKNIRMYSDTCKLTNSELMYYSKESPEDLTRFHYELYAILGASYSIDTRMELIISSGWYYTAVYGNLYRLKEYITFKCCHYESSKRVCAVFMPQQGFNPMPYFSIQIVTNYIRSRKHYLCVSTAIMPFTSSLDRIFENINLQISAASIFKTYLSSLRLQDLAGCKNKYLKHVAPIWKAAHDYYKGNLPAEWRGCILSFMAFLKNTHTQLDLINDTIQLDKVISTRNVLQSSNYSECNSTFAPYLFDLTSMGKDRCLDENFMYPDVCELKFESVKDGVFLLDSGSALYLYFAKSFHPNYSVVLFGRQKLLKGEHLSEDMLLDNPFCTQLQNLLRVLREGKTYGWAPLYIVRCGEHTLNEKNFYLNFYEEKYDEYRTYKMNYEEFTGMLRQQ